MVLGQRKERGKCGVDNKIVGEMIGNDGEGLGREQGEGEGGGGWRQF